MEFRDTLVELLDLNRPENIFLLIYKYLCGEQWQRPDEEVISTFLTTQDRHLLHLFLRNAAADGLNYEQFNELLLLLNQTRVGRPFYEFFFGIARIPLSDLHKPVVKFRGFAMLAYGNFRFAYKRLIECSDEELRRELAPYCRDTEALKAQYETRPPKVLDIDRIAKDKTWCLGEISGQRVASESAYLRDNETELLASGEFAQEELEGFEADLLGLHQEISDIETRSLRNTDVYLTWDYMDVYVACSMRNRWEFEDTFEVVNDIFSDKRLERMNLRFFDPTQSKCTNARDKGLVEGLMLKRAACTIYLAQESDTMGKDSELAATLAQRKPVIAYVPRYHPDEYAQKIKANPIDFFRKRILVNLAEDMFEQEEFREELSRIDQDFAGLVDSFLDKIMVYRRRQPFTLLPKKDEQFKRANADEFWKICQIVAVVECQNFDRRAALFSGRHPLAMQIDLDSGVANGVLVARSPEHCAEALWRILTNQARFSIDHTTFGAGKAGFTVLHELTTKSAFRVVTDNVKLSNSFWNLY